MNTATSFISLRASGADKITLTPSLSHRNGRGSSSIQRTPDVVPFSHPRPLPGRVRVEHSRVRPIFIGLVAVLWLSRCMVGPDYKRPAVEIPPQFRAAMTSDAQSIVDLKWFEVFKDEQLQELIRTALAQNYDLRNAIARVDQARANLGITQANQYPNFGV